jgi:hypothetical protein
VAAHHWHHDDLRRFGGIMISDGDAHRHDLRQIIMAQMMRITWKAAAVTAPVARDGQALNGVVGEPSP